MMIAAPTETTFPVNCPRCGICFDLPVLSTLHHTRPDLDPFIRIRVDHTLIDAHISAEHGTDLLA
jgi:hypothetical protein